MGTRYTTQSITGYNSSPPADDGSQVDSNKVKWATHKTKLSDPIKDQVAAIDAALVTMADVGPESKSAAYTTVAGDHLKTIEVTGTTTISLGDASTLAAGTTTTIYNADSSLITTVDLATGTDTLDGTAGGSTTLNPGESTTFIVNAGANGYLSKSNTGAKLGAANTWTQAQTFTQATPFIFEGATADAFETSFAITDPTADNTITVGDQTGTLVLGTAELPVATQLGGDYIKLSETQAANTQGGTFTSGSWVTRVLNTEDFDTGSNCTAPSSNRFTLDAGTYRVRITCPAHSVSSHKAKLVQDPAGSPSDALIGTTEYTGTSYSIQTLSVITGQVTIGAATTFEIQHRCQDTQASNGLGLASNMGVSEVYTVAEFLKVK